jgi:hypothetical protein
VAAEGASTKRMARLREGHNLQSQQGFRRLGDSDCRGAAGFPGFVGQRLQGGSTGSRRTVTDLAHHGVAEVHGGGGGGDGSDFSGGGSRLCRWFHFAQLAKGKKSRP